MMVDLVNSFTLISHCTHLALLLLPQNGQPRLHPLTRLMLYYRPSMAEQDAKVVQMMVDAREQAEVTLFHRHEIHRPVKDPRYDARLLTQKSWAHLPTAQDTDYVDVSQVEWRRGYGEDVDAVARLDKQPQQQA